MNRNRIDLGNWPRYPALIPTVEKLGIAGRETIYPRFVDDVFIIYIMIISYNYNCMPVAPVTQVTQVRTNKHGNAHTLKHAHSGRQHKGSDTYTEAHTQSTHTHTHTLTGKTFTGSAIGTRAGKNTHASSAVDKLQGKMFCL